MKQLIHKTLFLFCLFTFFFTNYAKSSYDFYYEGIYYKITDANNHYVEVASNGSNSYKGYLIIPSKVYLEDSVYTVKRIGDSAFKNCYSLSSVRMPESITEIGAYAFESCHKLSSIIIPDSVRVIHWHAFYGCI